MALLLLIVVLSRAFLPAVDNAYRSGKLVSSNRSVCRTSACVEYSEHLQRSLSTKANPCFNFYRYVCDTSSGTFESTLTTTSDRLKTHVLRSWLDDQAVVVGMQNGVSERTLLAASLFRSCVSGNGLGNTSSSDGVAQLRALMDERGLKWPYAVAPAPPPQDLLEVLVDWTLNWNVDVWFSLRVILADMSRRKFTFHVRHSAALQRWSKERAALQDGYMAFVTAYARELGASETEELDAVVQDVVQTEPEIEKILGGFPSDGSRQQKIETDAEPWKSAIQRKLGHSTYNVTAEDIAVISSQGLIAAVAILLSRDDKREKYYSSIGWAVARELGRLVSGSLRALQGTTSSDLQLWCWDRMDKFSTTSLVAPFYQSLLMGNAAALSRDIFDTLRSTIPRALSKSSWMDNRTKKIASSQIAALSLTFGFAKGIIPHDPLADQPSQSGGNRTVFGAWQRATTTYQSLSLEAKASLYSYDLLMSNAFFHGDSATVQLQPTLLQMPLYEDSLPVSLRYAGLGYVLMHQMMHALGDIFPLLEGDLRDPNLQSHPSFQERNRRVQCLRSFHREASASLGSAFSRYNYSDWFCGFATAPYLYEAVFGSSGDFAGRTSCAQREERLVGIEDLSAQQLFFVGLCSTLCTHSDPDNAPSSAEARCNVPLMHMPQFQSAFRCASGQPMIPTTRCSFW
ncbi:hypothetical protein HPB52_015732 [Rhipicephalus sanguineus]|uniref:Uncharacterized protein n=1 Tax=Rhipicephalus sanguineus TaxID=34632 RepID=A0A9D4T154_RHISA|nr:hypothetical protein HPB52_015732 [Rhipicephalus sanguineus]